MDNLFLFIVLSIIIYCIIFFYSKYESKIRDSFRKYREGKISRFIKAVGFKLVGVLFVIYIGITIYIFSFADDISRILISLIFITPLLILNFHRYTLFTLFGSILELFAKLLKPLFYHKKDYEQKVKSIFRLSIVNILLFLILLLSFSFRALLNENNYKIIGIVIIVVLIYYLIKSLVKVFLIQKDLILVSNHIEIISNFLDTLKQKKGSRNFVFLVTSIFTSMLSKEENSKIKSGIVWAKDKLKKINFFSKLGLSIFKTYLTVRLVLVLISTIVLVVIIFGNYFMALDNLSIIRTNFVTYPEYLLNTFYIFIGESVHPFEYSNNAEYFSYGFLFIGVIGWLLPVAYIILFIDIMSISVNEFYNSINELIKKTITDLNELFDKIISGQEKSSIPTEKITAIQEHLETINKKEKIINFEKVIQDLENLNDS